MSKAANRKFQGKDKEFGFECAKFEISIKQPSGNVGQAIICINPESGIKM